MQETDCDCLCSLATGLGNRSTYILFSKWRQNFTLVAHALGHLKPQPAGDKWLWFRKEEIIEVWSICTLNFEYIPETPCRNKRGNSPLALGQGIDNYRRTMCQELNIF